MSTAVSITSLPVKTLVKVLALLRGGEIGFDPYRDPRTSKKEALLAFILAEYANEEIISAVTETLAEQASHDAAKQAAEEAMNAKACVRLDYEDINGVVHQRMFYTVLEAQQWLQANPSNRSLGIIDMSTKIPTQAPQTPPTPFSPTTTETSDETAQLAALLARMTGKAQLDEAKVRDIAAATCDARAQAYVDNILAATNKRLGEYDAKIDALQMPVTVHVLKAESKQALNLGHQHKNFASLLKMAQARTRDGSRLNIWLKGPAGSGKTTAAGKVAEALGLPFHFNGAISTEYELMGFKDASGAYHRTAFRDAFEHGGVYLFDEIDSSLPKAVLAFNAALANGKCRFPDAIINRHEDCVILAGANTAGNGATGDYVGRMKQDLAFLNRFVLLDWPLDEALEVALAADKSWVRKVQKYRATAVKRGIKGHIISPRATFYGEALLAAGVDEELVEQAVLRGALSEEQWEQLCQ